MPGQRAEPACEFVLATWAYSDNVEQLSMGDSQPLVSIVIAVLNGVATLPRGIDSVASQTYARKELLVIDGGSTDGTLDVIRSRSADIAYWESGPDRSLYHAFNKALAHAKGDWIYFLGSDDYLWNSRVLESIAGSLAQAYPPARIVYSRAAFVADNGEILEILGYPWESFRNRFLQGSMIPHQAVFHHRSLFEAHGPFDDSFKVGGDYEMLLRELKQADPLFVPGVIVAGYQFGGGSSTPENSLKVLRAIRVAHLRHGIRFPGLLWLLTCARVYARLFLWHILGERLAKKVIDGARVLVGKKPFWTRV